MATIWNTLYLGNTGTQIDPPEGNSTSENASLLVGSTADPLVGDPTKLETNNRVTSDQMVFDLRDGAGTQSTTFDSVAEYQATVTYVDGTTARTRITRLSPRNGKPGQRNDGSRACIVDLSPAILGPGQTGKSPWQTNPPRALSFSMSSVHSLIGAAR